MKNIVITGGTGFVGHHLIEHLLKNTDWNIHILDKNSYSGDAAKVTELDIFDPDRIHLHWHDLRAPVMNSLINQIGKVDYLVHLAAESHVDNSILSPVDFIHNNVMGAVNILEYARAVKPDKVLSINTDEVFGPSHDLVGFKEWDRHLPSNPYSASKSAQDSIGISYWRTYDVPLIATHTMNMFGERQHVEKLVPKAISFLAEGKPVPVHAKGSDESGWIGSSRFWLHARNHADALLWILNEVSPKMYNHGENEYPEKFNVAGDIELTADQIVIRIADIMKVKPDIEFVDYHSHRPGHDMRYALDGSKIHSYGWKPPVDFSESLITTVNWTLEHRDRWL